MRVSGGALNFNGTNYVEVPYSAAINPSNYTISAYAQVTGGSGSWRTLIKSREDFAIKGFNIYAGNDDHWQDWLGNGSPNWSIISGSALTANWVLITATYDGSTMRFYQNGLQVNAATTTFQPNTKYPLRIGAGNTSGPPSGFFYGPIDDVRLYNRALSSGEVQALATGTLPVAVADGYVAVTNVALTVATPGVLGNDFDILGHPLTASIVQPPAHGTLTLNADGSFNYQSSLGFNGMDSFTYKANNGVSDSSPATVTLDVRSLSSGLLGYWKLDDGSGQIAVDSATTRNATIAGVATWTSGPLNGALQFNGTDTVATVLDDPALRLTGDMTITFWMKRNQRPSTWARMIGKGNDIIRNYGIWDSGPNGDKILFQQGDAAGKPALQLFSNTSVQFNRWVYVTTTIRSGQASIYINGILDSTGTVVNTPGVSADPLTFGYANFVNNAYFNGVLDDIRLYNRALAPVEIQALNQNTPPIAAPDSYTTLTGLTLNVPAPGVLSNDFDIAGRNMTATLTQPAVHGVVTLTSNGSFAYVPNAGFAGGDSFTYTASDGVQTSQPATVSLSVTMPIQVTAMTPAPGTTLSAPPNSIIATLNIAADPASVTTDTVHLMGSGPDGVFGTDDDVLITPASVSVINGNQIKLDLSGVNLPNQMYQVLLSGSTGAGNALHCDGGNYATVPNFGGAMPTDEITVEFWQNAYTSFSNPSTFGLSPDDSSNRLNAHVPWPNSVIYWDFAQSRLQYGVGNIYNSWQCA